MQGRTKELLLSEQSVLQAWRVQLGEADTVLIIDILLKDAQCQDRHGGVERLYTKINMGSKSVCAREKRKQTCVGEVTTTLALANQTQAHTTHTLPSHYRT
ncbi:hypothetical protein Pmani_007458 [Petrolisthes manimaculis]|uniref:Uncharacterized protein n=1 Tax=Petrolisthes manimaculis TaxID=1843537 RepID=A0AAE1UIS0_9EUCA|nr:hypothetical protein Pmani_007458 [Petrolisthes manimaculis]